MDTPKFERVIYISHPFQDKISNLRTIEKIILALKKENPTYLFVSPSHAFSFEYGETPYETSVEYCCWMLSKCDECWVFGDWENSEGCRTEIEYCRAHNIPLRIRTGYEKIVKEEIDGEV